MLVRKNCYRIRLENMFRKESESFPERAGAKMA